MSIWIIPLVVLAIAGSVFWLRPSPRDRHLADLRLEAMKQGLQVRQYTFKPQSEKNGVRDNVMATSYTLLLPGNPRAGALRYRIVGQRAWDNDGLPEGLWWDTEAKGAEREVLLAKLQQHLPELKDDLLMLEADQRRVTMMVAERPTASAQQYQHFLAALLAQ